MDSFNIKSGVTNLSRSIQLSLLLFMLGCVTRVASSPLSEMLFFQMSCSDDMSAVRSLSTDCNKYMICTAGYALAFSCPQGYIFSDLSMRCQLPNHYERQRCSSIQLVNMPLTCMQYRNARIPSYVSCAQYLDCGGQTSRHGNDETTSYVAECPYPKMFSTVTRKCEMFNNVRCVGRREPKAPCDYLQYQQLCEGPNCPPCQARHPSCVGKYDGTYPVGNSTSLYIVCLSERTINIGRCPDGTKFSVEMKTCVSNLPTKISSGPHELSALLAKIAGRISTKPNSISRSSPAIKNT